MKKAKPKLETNVIYCADNLDVMINLPSESIDMVYIDPPFFSERIYETIWGDKEDTASFNDRWKGGIHHYSEWLKPRLEQIHRLLKPNGTFFCHLDDHASHYVKVMLDEIFHTSNFMNEIIWKRTSTHNNAKQGRSALGRVHDTIFLFAKDISKVKFNTIYKPYSEEYLESNYKKKDDNGRRYKTTDLTAAKPGGDVSYTWKGVKPYKGRFWAYSKKNMENFDKKGLLYYTKTGMPRLKQYVDEMPGVSIDDVWADIPVAGKSERVGYPTQKPIALLKRILDLTTKPGDIVADFFCGCGTTLVAAHQTDRRYVGVDNSPRASKVVRKRLATEGFDIPELQVQSLSRDQILKLSPFDFEEYVVRCIGGEPNKSKVGDGGIDGRLIKDSTPIQVKKSKNVGRPVIDSFYKHLENNSRGIFIALSFGRGAYEEAAKLNRKGFDINLLTLDDVIDLDLHKEATKLERAVAKSATKRKKSAV